MRCRIDMTDLVENFRVSLSLFCNQAEIVTAVRGYMELSFEYLIALGKLYWHQDAVRKVRVSQSSVIDD